MNTKIKQLDRLTLEVEHTEVIYEALKHYSRSRNHPILPDEIKNAYNAMLEARDELDIYSQLLMRTNKRGVAYLHTQEDAIEVIILE